MFFGPKSQELQIAYLDRPATAYCFSPQESEALRREALHKARKAPMGHGSKQKSSPRSGQRQPATSYTTGSCHRAIHRSCKKHGIEKWPPNQIRHTTGTEIRSKYGLEAAQTVLGHSNAAVTEIYAERDLALAAKIARELGYRDYQATGLTLAQKLDCTPIYSISLATMGYLTSN